MTVNMKINVNEAGNLLLNLKQDITDSGSKSGSSEFYSMVMEETSSSMKNDPAMRDSRRELNPEDNIRETPRAERSPEIREGRTDDASGTRHVKERPSAENHEEMKPARKAENAEKVDEKHKVSSSEQEKHKAGSAKEQKGTELDNMLAAMAVEAASKKLLTLIQSAIKGETQDFGKKFRKLAEDQGLIRKTASGKTGEVILKTGEKNITVNDTLSFLKSDFIDKLGRELAKIINSRKGDEKRAPFTDKDMKEAVHGVAESIKKSRVKEYTVRETGKTQPDEIRSDKRNEIITETHTLKRKDEGAGHGFDTGGGRDKNSSREQGSLPASRMDSLSRSQNDKPDISVKNPEFRQSLQEVIDRARITVRDSNNGTFTVKLFPKELGSVNVNLLMENGVVSGRFLVDNDEAKNQLLDNLATLKEGLAEAGISVGEFSVNVSRDGRFTYENGEGDDGARLKIPKDESAAAVSVYDNNTASSSHDGHINMVI